MYMCTFKNENTTHIHTHTHTHTHTHFPATFHSQLSCYLTQLDNPDYVGWVTDAIEKEKMKQQHLQAVIEHLESEVTNMAGETVKHMQESMIHVSRGSRDQT